MNCAVVIGIEAYANSEWNLAAPVGDALRFTDWVLGPGEVPPQNLRLLLSPLQPLTTNLPYQEANQRNITKAIQDLQEGSGKGCTRLYFYYAGHGVSAPGAKRDGPIEPVIIPSDVSNLKLDSGRLIGFSFIMPLLKDVEPVEQFYFIDACRDFKLENFRPAIGAVGPWSPPLSEVSAQSAQYVLYSTSLGQRAYEEKSLRGHSVFAGTLMDALGGKAPGAMALSSARQRYEVRFSTLVAYVQNRIRQEVQKIIPLDWERYVQVPQSYTGGGSPDSTLATFKVDEISKLPVVVRVGPRVVRPTCRVQMLQWVSGLNRDVEVAIEGPPAPLPATFSLYPGDYALQATADQHLPVRQMCEVYEPRTVEVKLEPGPAPASRAPTVPAQQEFVTREMGKELGTEEVQLAFPDEAESSAEPWPTSLEVLSSDQEAQIVILDADHRIIAQRTSSVFLDDPEPGIYRVQLVLPQGVVQEQIVEVRPSCQESIKLTVPAPPLGQEQLRTLAGLGLALDEQGYFHPSEFLGGVAGLSLASLLGFAAFAAHFPHGFTRLKRLGVQPLDHLQPGASGLLVIIGASGHRPVPGLDVPDFLNRGRIVARRIGGEWMAESGFTFLPGFPAAAQYLTELPPGPVEARLDLPGAASTYYALACLPNRVTVLVVVANDTGRYEVQQYLVPVHPGSLPGPELLDDPSNIRRLELAQQYYAGGQALPEQEWGFLLYGKWLDPLLGALAGYSLVRTGRCQEYIELSAMPNMLNFFGELPDSHVLAGLCDQENRAQHYANALGRGLPIFAEGVQALIQWYGAEGKEMPQHLAEISQHLLPGSTWTAWASLRPALIIRAGHFQSPPQGWEVLEQHREAIEQALRAVGHLVVSGPGFRDSAVGFLVAEDVILTAFFPFSKALEATGAAKWRLKTGFSARIDFLGEVDTGKSAEFEITDLFGVEKKRNLTLWRLARQTPQGEGLPRPLLVASSPLSDLSRRRVYVIGYPYLSAPHPKAGVQIDPETMDRIFCGLFGVKRLQPGEIREIDEEKWQLKHDCLTGYGNAGSPVIDIETGLVLGIHFGGRWEDKEHKRSFALTLWHLQDNPLFQAAGVRFAPMAQGGQEGIAKA